MKQRTPRVDWAELLKRTFDFDVFACVRCGGRRSVLAYVKAGRGVRAILEHLGLPTAGVSLAPAQESTQAAYTLALYLWCCRNATGFRRHVRKVVESMKLAQPRAGRCFAPGGNGLSKAAVSRAAG